MTGFFGFQRSDLLQDTWTVAGADPERGGLARGERASEVQLVSVDRYRVRRAGQRLVGVGAADGDVVAENDVVGERVTGGVG
ncbi:MAG: hypothetical protein GEV04_16360 [Actinophytocola sp.]|nr:hypothetical protein [Actinophytocola sp.]